MKKNMGLADRIIRIVLALALGVLLLGGTVSGILAWVLGIVAVILLLTSIISLCPLYLLFGITTSGKSGAGTTAR